MKVKTEAARTAQVMRKELKTNFPGIKFKVRSDTYSMGDSVSISWDNGPTTKAVNDIVNKYQYGHFNGMEDIYEYSNKIEDIPQVKFVQTSRHISDDIYNQAFEFGKQYLTFFENIQRIDEYHKDIMGTARNYLWRILSKMDLRKDVTMQSFQAAFLRN